MERGKRGTHIDYCRKAEGKRSLGSPLRRWVDRTEMYLVDVGRGEVEWMGLV
jgi:hypothetical protein